MISIDRSIVRSIVRTRSIPDTSGQPERLAWFFSFLRDNRQTPLYPDRRPLTDRAKDVAGKTRGGYYMPGRSVRYGASTHGFIRFAAMSLERRCPMPKTLTYIKHVTLHT